MGDEYTPEYLPDRRRHGYQELEQKLEEHTEAIESRFQRFFIMALIAFSIIGLTSAGALVGYGVLLRQTSHQADEIQQQTTIIQRQTNIIQQQRRDSVRKTCQEQNERHKNTVKVFNGIFAKALKKATDPVQRAQLLSSRNANLLVINALAPHQNCDEVVRKAVPTEGGP